MDTTTATTIACWWLAALGIFTLAHAVGLIRQWFWRPIEHEFEDGAHRLGLHLSHRAQALSRPLAMWETHRSDPTLTRQEKISRLGAVAQDARRQLKTDEDDALRDVAGHEDPTLAEALERSLADGRTIGERSRITDATNTAYRKRAGWWRSRLFIPFVAAAPSGAAPTLTGVMVWLEGFQEQSATGAQAGLKGLYECLGTTAAGCALTVFSILLMYLADQLLTREKESLREAIMPVLDQRRKVKDLRERVQSFLRNTGRPQHA